MWFNRISWKGIISVFQVQTKLENVPEELGVEGRLIVAEYDKFYLINAYVPNSGRGLVNLAKRKVWDDFFIDYIKQLDASKAVIYAGDLNVAHEEIGSFYFSYFINAINLVNFSILRFG